METTHAHTTCQPGLPGNAIASAVDDYYSLPRPASAAARA